MWSNCIGLGVAGNFAGHLEQAGEATDFVAVKTQDAIQPKAIFPFYVPSEHLADNEQFLSVYPLSSQIIRFPQQADNLQIEPEIALICDIEYSAKKVTALLPRYFAAYNDCSIRRPNAKKICEKKNWGAETKGLSSKLLPLSHFASGSEIDRYRIACFHQRGDVLTEYGVNSAAISYSYFHQQLLDWIVDRMNHQPDQDPMNNIAQLLEKANFPTRAIISIGATRYTAFGEKNYLQIGDRSIVLVYPDNYQPDELVAMIQQNQFADDISALVQEVV